MRAVVQRVSSARVTVEGETVGAIEQGLLVYLGVGKGDGAKERDYLVDKILGLRIFSNEEGKFDRSVVDVGGSLLVVSQFTLYADVRKGRRPGFDDAMPPADAEREYEAFVAAARARGIIVATGKFRERVTDETDETDETDSAFELLWSRVLENWDEPKTHAALLEYAVQKQRLPQAAGRYRALVDDSEKGPAAKKRLEGIVVATTSLLMATATPPTKTKTPAVITFLALVVTAALLFWLARALLGAH
jgi:D-aminoacyl-tRNA deacylase